MNQKIKCKYCGISFDKDSIREHEDSCAYIPTFKDYQNLIPCEICNEFISFDDYSNHISTCSLTPRNINFNANLNTNLDMINNLINVMYPNINHIPANVNNDELVNEDYSESNTYDNEEENEENEDNEENEENDYLGNTSENYESDNEQNNPLVNSSAHAETLNQNAEDDEMSQTEINSQLSNINYSIDYLTDINNILTDLINTYNLPLPANNDEYDELINLQETIGTIEVGIDVEEVSVVKDGEIKCPICFEETTKFRETTCKHQFCAECLKNWLKSSKKCPICMTFLG